MIASIPHTCTRRLRFEAAHRVLRHESKCAHLHGHSYVAEVSCLGSLDDVGRVLDFGVIKDLLGGWIDDAWDHGTLVNGDDMELISWLRRQDQKHYAFVDEDGIGMEPTAEVIAGELLGAAQSLLGPTGVEVASVRIRETENCSAGVVPWPI